MSDTNINDLLEVFLEHFSKEEAKKYAIILHDEILRSEIGIPTTGMSAGKFVSLYTKWYNEKSVSEKELFDDLLTKKQESIFGNPRIGEKSATKYDETKKENLIFNKFMLPNNHGLKEHVGKSVCLFIDEMIEDMKQYFNSVMLVQNDDFGTIKAVSKNGFDVKIDILGVKYDDSFGMVESEINFFVHSPEKFGDVDFWGFSESLEFDSKRSKKLENNQNLNRSGDYQPMENFLYETSNHNMKVFVANIAEKYKSTKLIEYVDSEENNLLKNNDFLFPKTSWMNTKNYPVKQSKHCKELGWAVVECGYPDNGFEIFVYNGKTGEKISDSIYKCESRSFNTRYAALSNKELWDKEKKKLIVEAIEKINEIEKFIEKEISIFGSNTEKISSFITDDPEYLDDMEHEFCAYGGDAPCLLVLDNSKNKLVLHLSNIAYEKPYDECVSTPEDEEEFNDDMRY